MNKDKIVIFDQVHLISRHIQPVLLAEVIQLEGFLGIQLPEGYKLFITRWGSGRYCDLFRIYTPDQIMQNHAKDRASWKDWAYFDDQGRRHWFYEGSEGILNESQLQECAVIGDSIDGDKLVFFPDQRDKIYTLPRHSQTISWVKSDFSDLHRWDSTTPRLLTFAPWHGQITLSFFSKQYNLDQTGCLEQFKQHWGTEYILVSHEDSNQWSWAFIFFVPPIGGRVQVTQDEGVTRTYVDENGNTITVKGNGQRRLSFTFYCDEEAATEVEAFMAYFEAEGLCHWEH